MSEVHRLRIFLLALLTFSLLGFFSFNVYGNSIRNSTVQSDQVLYFQPTISDSGLGSNSNSSLVHTLGYYTMNTDMPIGQGLSGVLNYTQDLFFVSPPLAQDFTLQEVRIDYYTSVAQNNTGIDVSLYVLDTHGLMNFLSSASYPIPAGSDYGWFSMDPNAQISEQERIIIIVSGSSAYLGPPFDFYWGNSTYPSQISYNGEASFIPEFPSFLFPALSLVAMVSIVLVKRKNTRWKR